MIINRSFPGGHGSGVYAAIRAWGDVTEGDTVYAVNGSRTIHGVYSTVDYSHPRYLRWEITKRRGATSDANIQIAEFRLVNAGGSPLVWSGVTITSNMTGNTNETIDKLIDNSTSTKYCTGAWGTTQSNVCTIVMRASTQFDLATYNRYQYYTANDADVRDPVSWTLAVSDDGESWVEVDARNDQSITSTRNTVAGTWNMSLSQNQFIMQKISEYGEWTVTAQRGGTSRQYPVLVDAATMFSVQVGGA